VIISKFWYLSKNAPVLKLYTDTQETHVHSLSAPHFLTLVETKNNGVDPLPETINMQL